MRRLQRVNVSHDAIGKALASNDPQLAIAEALNTIERLVDLVDGLLVDSVRVTRRRT